MAQQLERLMAEVLRKAIELGYSQKDLEDSGFSQPSISRFLASITK